MIDNDVSYLKNLWSLVSAPAMFILGIIGWHYKGVSGRVTDLTDSHADLKESIGKHGVHIRHLHDCVHRLDEKLDQILEKITK